MTKKFLLKGKTNQLLIHTPSVDGSSQAEGLILVSDQFKISISLTEMTATTQRYPYPTDHRERKAQSKRGGEGRLKQNKK